MRKIYITGDFNDADYGNVLIDHYNSNHIDYRGFIEKNLAIEVTEDNNPYK